MRVLVIGGNGRLGFEISKSFSSSDTVLSTFNSGNRIDNGGLVYEHLDISNKTEVNNVIEKFRPEIIIHSAALTDVDLCEVDKELAYNINVTGTENLVKSAEIIDSRFVYISSAFVFDGKREVYTEEDKPNPINYYGFTKLKGEELVADSGIEFLILRTDQPYGILNEGQRCNNVYRVLNALRSSTKTKEPEDWFCNPTFIPNFAYIMKNLIMHGKSGIYNLVGPDYVSRFEWAVSISKILGLDSSLIIKSSIYDLGLTAKRPNVKLSVKKVEFETGIKTVGIYEGVSSIKSNLESM